MQAKTWLKKIGIISGITVASASLVITGAAIAFYHFTLDKNSRIHMSRLAQRNKKTNTDDNTVKFSGTGGREQGQRWFAGKSRDAYITSDDGLKLHAHLFQNDTAKNHFVITCHGYTSSGAHMANFAKHFYDLGFSVLVPDARSHGTSEGYIMGMGWLDRKDILQWIQYVTALSSDAEIVLHGVSMGGATVMMVAGEKVADHINICLGPWRNRHDGCRGKGSIQCKSNH